MFEKVLRAHPDVFPAKYIDKDLFMNIFGQVSTRNFGYSIESSTLIPMADNLNHNSVEVRRELVNTTLHLNATENENYFRIRKVINDFSLLYVGRIPEEQMVEHKVAGRFDREVYSYNSEVMSAEHVRKLMQTTSN